MAHAKVAAGWSADVLIVDDTVHVRELYAEYLTALGGRVATAEDGEAAVAAARRSRPDVIVMDLAMPRMDGATAIKQLRADSRTRDVPIILLTGHPYDAIQYGGLEAGADVFLTKPCLPEELHEQIVQLLNRRLRPAA